MRAVIAHSMAPKKTKTLTKSEKKKALQEKSRKAHAARGLGVGGRRNFALPARWHTEQFERSGILREQYVSPGKTLYKTQKSVEETFDSRDRKRCLKYEDSTDSETDNEEKDPDFQANSVPEFEIVAEAKGTDHTAIECEGDKSTDAAECERRMFVCETPQLLDFVDQINRTSKCSTPSCEGREAIVLFHLVFL